MSVLSNRYTLPTLFRERVLTNLEHFFVTTFWLSSISPLRHASSLSNDATKIYSYPVTGVTSAETIGQRLTGNNRHLACARKTSAIERGRKDSHQEPALYPCHGHCHSFTRLTVLWLHTGHSIGLTRKNKAKIRCQPTIYWSNCTLAHRGNCSVCIYWRYRAFTEPVNHMLSNKNCFRVKCNN